LGSFLVRKCLFGNRDAALDQRSSLFGLGDRCDDAPPVGRRLDGGFTIGLCQSFVKDLVAFGQYQGAGEVPQQCFSMAGAAAKGSAGSSMSHGFSPVESFVVIAATAAIEATAVRRIGLDWIGKKSVWSV
jgi:hypothetical protein